MPSRTSRTARAASARAWAPILVVLVGTLACGGSDDGNTVDLRLPELVTEPADQVAREGAAATFAAAISADTPAALRWERAAPGSTTWTAIPGATSATYTTAALAPADHGTRVRVVVTNDAGSRTSRAASLSVTWLHLVASPHDATTTAGSDVSFEAVFEGNPAPSIHWEQAPAGGAWTDIADATSGLYVLAACPVSGDGARFHAVAVNAYGEVTSADAVLDVAATQIAPAIDTQPADQTGDEGGRVTFAATVSGVPAPAVQWERQAPGAATWTAIPGATSGSYTTPALTPGDLGASYRLVATSAAGTATTRAAALTVRWLHLVSSPADVAVTVGDAATFTASFDGSPAPALHWEIQPPGGAWAAVPGAGGASWTFPAAALTDDGMRVRAVAVNAATAVQSLEAVLTVQERRVAPAIVAQPVDQAGDEGLTATFGATASGTPTPSLQWERRAPGSADWTPVAGATSGTYTTPALLAADDGASYRLVATSAEGRAESQPALLTVRWLHLVTPPASVTVVAGEAATFTVDFQGSPAPVLQWQSSVDGVAWSDLPGATSSTYAIAATVAGDDGLRLRAVATSAAAASPITSAEATLTVQTDPARIDVHPGESIQAAIDAAAPGTTIHVYPGTYAPDANAEAFLVFRPEKNGVVLRGEGATPGEVVLDGSQRVLHVLLFDQGIDRSTRVENLTITGGRAVPTELFQDGIVPEPLHPEIPQGAENRPLSDFYTDGAGAMLFRAAPTLDRVVVVENTSGHCGGGLSVFALPDAPWFLPDGPDIRNSEFLRNHTEGGGPANSGSLGAAIDVHLNGTRASVVNCLFVGNNGWGGQVTAMTGSTLSVRSSTFVGNLFDPSGPVGGVRLDGAVQAEVRDSIFVHQTGEVMPPIWNEGGATALQAAGNVYWDFTEGWIAPEGSGIEQDPLLVAGPRGDHYLSQTAAGQPADSPAVNAGSGLAAELLPGDWTTSTTGAADTGQLDAGYHYAP
ncbi:immunoglobulin domain-containing protein [Anaeromyxobacter dehalogenans]|uniref:Putative vgr-related protein n=1 Tax=Anaeromyxobacter dehalogenans (strain 2CP-C) TaxID=290397 RepID=Q2IPN8_ANADE|nr:immunoglobulin domain-containing protein [Anaeromyxobacter dehalogenans]ABC80767.1 putative vgr-related protein [Anaeromyxobacter dehalogenans 2CP-C]